MKHCEVTAVTDKDGKVVGTAIVCGSKPSAKPGYPPCYVCIEVCIPSGQWRKVRDGIRQCDHPLGGTHEDGTKKTCDRYICVRHSARRGSFDFCPDHREANGFPPLANDNDFNTAGAKWITTRYVSGCVVNLPGCARSMGRGKRALHLPQEHAVACESCGNQLMGHPETQGSLL